MGKPSNKFTIPDPKVQIANIVKEVSKYTLGSEGYTFGDIKSLKPTFAFDYLSLTGGKYCFDSNKLVKEDYLGLLKGLRKVSDTSYQTLHDTRGYRFHKVDFNDPRVTIKRIQFKKILTNKPEELRDEELPNLWQFDIQYVQEARVCGFLYKGVFYLVWFDRNHEIYPSKK
jgi:hypothetical protein